MVCIAIISNNNGRNTISAVLKEADESECQQLDEILFTGNYKLQHISGRTCKAWKFIDKAIEMVSDWDYENPANEWSWNYEKEVKQHDQ